MKNQSTHKGKGKAWGHPAKGAKEGYNQHSSGDSGNGSPSSKFIGPTKGNSDLPPNRTAGVKSGAGDPHGAGGK